MDVSVIIPTWNNCRRLAITLDAMAACRVPAGLRWEVIVVDNNCTDDTAGVAAAFNDRLPLVFLKETTPGSGVARNRGIDSARGRLLVFADDDVRPASDWLDAYWQAFARSGDQHFYGGPLSHEYETTPDEALLKLANRSIAGGLDLGRAELTLPPGHTFMGANWAAPVEAVRRAGGFDPDLALDRSAGKLRAGEDVDLMERIARLGQGGRYVPAAQVVHYVPAYKCTLGYVSSHLRCLGAYSLRRKTVCTALQKRPQLRAALGEERWTAAAIGRLAGATAMFGVRWLACCALGQFAADDRVALMYCLGRWQGYLSNLRRWARER